MTTPAQTPNIMKQLSDQGAPPPSSDQSGGNIFQQLAAGTYKDPDAAPEVSPEEQQSKVRQMLVSGMTGMPSPVMNDQDKAEFAKGKAVGAVSVPAVAGMYLGAHAALSAGIPPLIKALTGGAVGLGTWAAEHPIAAKIIYHGLSDAIKGTSIGVGAKVAGKVIDAF